MLAIAALTLAIVGRLAAQVPATSGPTVAVIGLVVDSVTGLPIDAARVSVGVGGPGVASNTLGRFALPNVPLGTRRIVVTRLGYQDLEAIVQITDPMGGIQLKISPDPVQLEGIATQGGNSDDLRGRVVDADTGEPVPYAQIVLTRDGVRRIGRRFRSTDTLGNFVLPDIGAGGYVLRVERPGYGIRLQQLVHERGDQPFLITLSHDARRAAALAALMAQFDSRVSSAPKAAVVGEEKLQTAELPMLDGFLKWEGPQGWGYDISIGANESGRNAPPPPAALYVDGVRQQYATPETFGTKEFYRIDFIECARAEGFPPRRVQLMLAYTYAYIEELMANPNTKRGPRDFDLDNCLRTP